MLYYFDIPCLSTVIRIHRVLDGVERGWPRVLVSSPNDSFSLIDLSSALYCLYFGPQTRHNIGKQYQLEVVTIV